MWSIWEREHFHRRADVAVIGAGIVGLFAAVFQKRAHPHHHVVVLERGAFPSGASVKNAGFACFGSPSEILSDIDTEGADTALARVEERWRGLLELRAELGDATIGLEPCGGHELFGHDTPLYTRVAERFDALNKALHGIFGRPVFTWDDTRAARMGLHTDHVAFTDLEAGVDSGALITTLLAKARAEGVVVLTNMHVTALNETATGVELAVNGQPTVQADRVLLCTNGYLRELLPDVDVLPARGQVLITAPVPGLALKGTFHADEGYYYFRELNGRVLLGGGRHLDKAGETKWEDATTPRIQGALEELLRNTILPGHTFTIEHRWTGVMGFRTACKSALVERRSPRLAVAAGLSGMGVAIGIRVARQAAKLLDE